MEREILNFLVTSQESGMRLDIFLATKLNLSRNKINKMLHNKQITLNQTQASKNGIILKEQDQIHIFPSLLETAKPTPKIHIPILYEDEDLLVLNKPINLVVHKTNQEDTQYTLHEWLKEQNFKLSNLGDSYREGIIHRLDKTTSGAIVIAKNNHSHQILSQQLKTKEMGRYYLCVINQPLKQDIIIDSPLIRHPKNRLKYITTSKQTPDSKDAKTAFFKIIDNGKTELIGAKLFSGRTHQIRAHLSKINRHILGDFFYNYKGNYTQRILLHSSLLYLKHPTTQKPLKIYAPLFEDMLLFLHQNFYASQDFESFTKNFILPLQDIYLSKFT
ncbi:RluA family pseudouridine synthase [Helicobacter pullorum]|uniref:Pseudouridine synthase n=1 Tax=Helicobacter pullorum TaxID=35818 RepID=A0A377PZQ9_9HELI|nr:RluA family pseudouridine synthase [Helicobacter pullorum]STQ87721.1 ribosomal pseudouridine synthase [Helicobacter pullorum]